MAVEVGSLPEERGPDRGKKRWRDKVESGLESLSDFATVVGTVALAAEHLTLAASARAVVLACRLGLLLLRVRRRSG